MNAWLGSDAGLDPGAMSLAAFHTFFIALGVVIFLPLVPRFAALVERPLAERGENLTQRLDDSMLAIPAVALEASERALEQTATRLLQAYSDLLKGRSEELAAGRLQEFRRSLDTAYAFVSRIKCCRTITPARPSASPSCTRSTTYCVSVPDWKTWCGPGST